MRLVTGTRLGPYEIVGVLGAGGMGEVYQARDSRLDRMVAIKVLPGGVAGDLERRRRFEQEARAVSALNHPHICTLYDIGSEVPAASPEQAPVDFLVMECLEGRTLKQELERKRSGSAGATRRLGVAEALDYAIQIADALSAAHRAGIVHRDLKPGNIMVTKAGLKLLDFGLAKLRAAGPEVPDEAASGTLPTVSAPMSPGTVFGTAPYMAPEVIGGKEAGARADLFAFGCVLYEMLAGRRAFEGDSQSSIIAAILEDEPRPLSALQPLSPPALNHVVSLCLAKDPDERWQSAADVERELRWIRDTARAGNQAGDVPYPRRRTLGALLSVAGGLAMLGTGAGLARWLLPASPRAMPTHVSLEVTPAEGVSSGRPSGRAPTPGGARTALAWTPDGKTLIFVGRRGGKDQLYSRPLTSADASPIEDTVGADAPAVSPDGRWVAFWADEAIRKTPLAGGPGMAVMQSVGWRPAGLVWDDRGGLLFGSLLDGRIWLIPAEGQPSAITTVGEGEILHCLPWPLPRGRAVLYTVRKREWGWGDEEIVAQFPTGERRPLIANACDARYVPTGHLVFLRQGRLFAVPFDADRVQVLGNEFPVLDNVAQALTAGTPNDVTGAGQFAVAATGALAWIPGPVVPHPDLMLVTVDRRGRVTPLPGAPARSYAAPVRLSPAGDRRLAVAIFGLTETGLWLYDLDRTTLTQLVFGGEANFPLWSPDGKHILFGWLTGGGRSLAQLPADGTAPPEVVVKGGLTATSFTPDGRNVLAVEGGDIAAPQGPSHGFIVSLEGRASGVRRLIEAPKSQMAFELSPDGRWLAYVSNESGRPEVYLRPFPGPGSPKQVSIDGGQSPAWHPGGTELFFVSLRNAANRRWMLAAEFAPGPPERVGLPRPLFEFDGGELILFCNPTRCYDVAPDGQQFYGVQRQTPPGPPVVTHINLILNWFEELKVKVPKGQ